MSIRGFLLVCLLLAGLVTPAAGLAQAEEQAAILDILVFGASGKVGSHVVEEALSRGHRVTGVSRTPAGVSRRHERFTVVQGDLLDPDSVSKVIEGHDAVVISVRGVVGPSENPADTVARIGVENVVHVLRETGLEDTYLLHVGGAATLEVAPGVLLADRVPRLFMSRDMELEIAGQVQALEFLRGVKDVAWTCVTPPRTMTGGRRKGVYRTGGDRLMEDDRGKSMISRADFAVAVIDEAEYRQFLRKRFSVADW